MRKTDKELIEALQPLKDKMIQYNNTSGGSLTAGEVQLLQVLYPDMQERAQGQMTRVFTASCSTCVRDTFAIFTSWFLRESALMAEVVPDPVMVNDVKKVKKK